MSDLKKDIEQAIADFDAVEQAIESCGIDVPYNTNTSEYGSMVKQVYSKGVEYGAETSKYELPVATKSTLGGIKIGENIAAMLDGTTTVKTASKISADDTTPAKASAVYKAIDDAYLTNEEIEELLNQFS